VFLLLRVRASPPGASLPLSKGTHARFFTHHSYRLNSVFAHAAPSKGPILARATIPTIFVLPETETEHESHGNQVKRDWLLAPKPREEEQRRYCPRTARLERNREKYAR
jgi:hypothetical protein